MVKLLDAIPAGEAYFSFVDRGRNPAEGLDCWGLLWHVFDNDLDIQLDSYVEGYRSSREVNKLSGMIPDEATKAGWIKVKTGDEIAYDAALMAVNGRPVHVGLIVTKGLILHTMPNLGTCLERYPNPSQPSRVIGIFRHPSMVNHAHAQGCVETSPARTTRTAV